MDQPQPQHIFEYLRESTEHAKERGSRELLPQDHAAESVSNHVGPEDNLFKVRV